MKIPKEMGHINTNITNNLSRVTDKEKQPINQSIKSKYDSVEISNSLTFSKNMNSAQTLLREEYSNYNYKNFAFNNSQRQWEKKVDKERVFIIVHGKLIELPAIEKEKNKDVKTDAIDTEKENKATGKTKVKILSLLETIIEDEQNIKNQKNSNEVNYNNREE